MSQSHPIIDRHDQFMSPNYTRYDVAFVRGEGSRLWDVDGKSYLDLFAGYGAPVLGHCHPDLVEAVSVQATRLWHVGNLFHTEPQTQAAEAIARLGFGGQSFFSHSGADANEAAIKLARLHGQAHPGPEGPRFKVISTTQSFHGRSFATMGATGNPKVREGFEPLLPGFVNVPYNDLDAIKAEIDDTTVAIIAEPIQGEGGMNMPEPGFFASLRKLCDQHNLLLICDEVWTGCGRTGDVFAHQHENITPDIMTLGKGVGGGLPVGVMCALPEHTRLVNPKLVGAVKHATTLGGNCLSMAATAAVFHVIERDNLIEHVRTISEVAKTKLAEIQAATHRIKEVRGRGLFLGVELDLADSPHDSAAALINACRDNGLIIGSAQGQTIRLAPPITIKQEELLEGLELLSQTLAV